MYKYIQGCRAAAAFFVVVLHISATMAEKKYFGIDAAFIERLFSFGYCGVAFFFVLSGFIITLIHQKDFGVPTRLATYVRKRVVRIYPSYIIIFTCVYLLAIAFASTRNTVPHSAVVLIKSILLLPQDPNIVGGTGAPVLGVAWTLQYEMIFYVAIGFAIINRYLFASLILVFLVNFGFCAFQSTSSFPQSFFANKLIFLFLFGMMAAFIAKSKVIIKYPMLISIMAGIAFLCVAVMEILLGKKNSFLDHNLIYGVISAILIIGLVRTEDNQSHRSKKSLGNASYISLIGDASYALYLIHFPIISILCKLAIKVGLHGIYGALIAFFVILTVCILSALGFYSYVERPILSRLSMTPRRNANPSI